MAVVLSLVEKALTTDPLTLALCCILVLSVGLAWRSK